MLSGSLSRSRALSLRAPIADEGDRAHFQRRLALTSFVVSALAFGFWLTSLVLLLVLAPSHVHRMWTSTTSKVQLATTAFGILVWLAARSSKRSAPALDALDVLGAVGLCAGWAVMASTEAQRLRPDLVALLACTYTLVVRAALVPSTPARTAILGAVAFVPLEGIATQRYLSTVEATPAPLPPPIYLGIWALLAVAATTTISWVIYGLRLQVRRAQQLGQYLLEEKVGEGGMGAVYRASHAMLRRPTAIKLLSGAKGSAVERFEREVQMTAKLTHPNTVAIYDYGRTPDGVFYYAMEYLDGLSLEELVREDGAQPPSRVVHILLQVCAALEEAHDMGLVHRDIKPANVMLTTRGGVPDVVKVVDFGLVKNSIDETPLAVTNATAILGTPHFMAPESILTPDAVDARTDIYALGATAFYLLTGAYVFEGANIVEVCGKHVHQSPAPPSSQRPDVPAELDAIVLACLAKTQHDRPASAADLAERLRAANVGAWTRADARAWWSVARKRRRGGSDAPPTPAERPQTIAVALDDRA